jgi:RNA polymerase sigma factor (sigma-70 family)
MRLRKLLASYEAAIKAQLLRLAPKLRAADVDDLMQEVRIRLWQTIKSEKNLERPASYLRQVVLTATIDALRRGQSRGDNLEHLQFEDALAERNDPGIEPIELILNAQRQEVVDVALAKLGEENGRALRLYLQGYNVSEIAMLLEWSEGKARNLVYRAVEQLKKVMQHD